MIKHYYNLAPDPTKVALFLDEARRHLFPQNAQRASQGSGHDGALGRGGA